MALRQSRLRIVDLRFLTCCLRLTMVCLVELGISLVPTEARRFDTPIPPADAERGDVWVSPRDDAEMVFVRAGAFLRGSEHGTENERPQREITLAAFWVDRYEVTNEQFLRFAQQGGARPGRRWREFAAPDRARHPVRGVRWADAIAYAAWAGKRLATEAEWEKAARGTDGRTFPWGNGWSSSCCNSGCPGDGFEQTAPIGSFPSGASPYGCEDMAGNVWEWCFDLYGKLYYEIAPLFNPPGIEKGRLRVVRGGSWMDEPGVLRCAARAHTDPNVEDSVTGFRCVLSAP